jgi:hypothetical protein
MHTAFWWEIQRERDHYEGLDVDWIYLAQDRDQCWAVVNAVTKLRVSENVGKFLGS